MKHLCILLLFASVMLSAADTAKPAAAKPAATTAVAKPADQTKPATATAAKPADDKPASVLTSLFHVDLDPAAFADQEKAEKLIRQRAELQQKIQAERKRLLEEDSGAKKLREEILLLNRKLASLLETKKSMIELNSQLRDLDIAISRLKPAPEPEKETEPAAKAETKAGVKADAKADAKAETKPAVKTDSNAKK
ncbi:MAG: hypothetical protein IKQ82_06730 [Lentisphaeria bacterium]|nr:hypothetical protein [Lentisphaeria bacterium]